MAAHPGFLVVGLDQSAGAQAALDFALEEGLARGDAVEIVTAWLWGSLYEGMETVGTLAQGHQVAQDVQDKALRQALDKLPACPVIARTVVHESPGRLLVSRAEGARMLVVGSGRKGAVTRAVLGSVSEYCVRHAPSPVVVVPDPDRLRHRQPGEVETVADVGVAP